MEQICTGLRLGQSRLFRDIWLICMFILVCSTLNIKVHTLQIVITLRVQNILRKTLCHQTCLYTGPVHVPHTIRPGIECLLTSSVCSAGPKLIYEQMAFNRDASGMQFLTPSNHHSSQVAQRMSIPEFLPASHFRLHWVHFISGKGEGGAVNPLKAGRPPRDSSLSCA